MQWPLIACLFLVAILCLIQGLRKSTLGRSMNAQYNCSACGWTTELVQLCRIEHQHTSTEASLCFECAIEREAIPVRNRPMTPSYAVAH